MRKVSWSDRAEADLDRIASAVADQLRRNAEEILHDIPPVEYAGDEGAYGGIMWHRGDGHAPVFAKHDGGTPGLLSPLPEAGTRGV